MHHFQLKNSSIIRSYARMMQVTAHGHHVHLHYAGVVLRNSFSLMCINPVNAMAGMKRDNIYSRFLNPCPHGHNI